jgi:protein arginine kinase
VDPRLRPLVETMPAWLQAGGPEGDVAVASRVRLARNLSDAPFPAQMQLGPASDLVRRAEQALQGALAEGRGVDPSSLPAADCDFLVERSLASRDLIHAGRATWVYFEPRGLAGVMVNEEDHFRIQGYAAGLDLPAALRRAQRLERRLRQGFDLAAHERFGYLTSCPTNAGSGMRASVLLHLPALVRAKAQIQQVLQTARNAGLAVRGLHGEGGRALGRLYQMSNQVTLGTTSAAQAERVTEFGLGVAAFERRVRQHAREDASARRELIGEVERAHARLQEAPALTTAEALDALSTIRLAALAGLAEEIGHGYDPHAVLQQMFQLQPGHLQARLGRDMDPGERDAVRAGLLRAALDLAA